MQWIDCLPNKERQNACTHFWNRAHVTSHLNATQFINRPIMSAHIPVDMAVEQMHTVNTHNSHSCLIEHAHSARIRIPVNRVPLVIVAILFFWESRRGLGALGRPLHAVLQFLMGNTYAFVQFGAHLNTTCILMGIGHRAFAGKPKQHTYSIKMKLVGNNLPLHVKDSTTLDSRRNILQRDQRKFHLILIKRTFNHRLFQTLYASLV